MERLVTRTVAVRGAALALALLAGPAWAQDADEPLPDDGGTAIGEEILPDDDGWAEPGDPGTGEEPGDPWIEDPIDPGVLEDPIEPWPGDDGGGGEEPWPGEEPGDTGTGEDGEAPLEDWPVILPDEGDGGTAGEWDPVLSDCGGCEVQALGGEGPVAPSAVPDVRSAGRGEASRAAGDPVNICLSPEHYVAWLCAWQGFARP